MNYLQLVQRAVKEAGAGDGTQPTTLDGLTGMQAQMATWVQNAWDELQKRRTNWLWQYGTGTLALSQSTREYTAASASITDLNRWDTTSFTYYKDADGVAYEAPLPYREFFKEWRPYYEIGNEKTAENSVARFTVTPNKRLRFHPVPDQAYTVNFAYWKSITQLTTGTDTPALPADHHMILVWHAVLSYASEGEVDYLIRKADREYKSMLFDLERDQLPELIVGAGPLA